MSISKIVWVFRLATALTGLRVALTATALFLEWSRRGFAPLTIEELHRAAGTLVGASWPLAAVLALWLLVAGVAKGTSA